MALESSTAEQIAGRAASRHRQILRDEQEWRQLLTSSTSLPTSDRFEMLFDMTLRNHARGDRRRADADPRSQWNAPHRWQHSVECGVISQRSQK